jgi:hypothetical protein
MVHSFRDLHGVQLAARLEHGLHGEEAQVALCDSTSKVP